MQLNFNIYSYIYLFTLISAQVMQFFQMFHLKKKKIPLIVYFETILSDNVVEVELAELYCHSNIETMNFLFK